MVDQNNISLEKVVKELARIREDHFGGMTSYEGEVLDAALALLKKQEPVEPKREIRGCGFRWFCGDCGINIEPNHMYCRICGRPVKWK